MSVEDESLVMVSMSPEDAAFILHLVRQSARREARRDPEVAEYIRELGNDLFSQLHTGVRPEHG